MTQQSLFWSSKSAKNTTGKMLSSSLSVSENAIKPKVSRRIGRMREASFTAMATTASWCFLLVTYITLSAISTVATTDVPSTTTTTDSSVPITTLRIETNGTETSSMRLKGGRCPKPGMDTRLCGDQSDQCTNDVDCAGESLCCHTGCSRVCILPVFTACEQVRSSAERRARSLEAEFAKDVQVPECDSEGNFKEVQCDPAKEICYCVDSQGFEMPGTRARGGREMVNCSDARPCNGPMCRMLCPYGFQLDDNGCEVCECRNVCKGVQCPGETQCEMEEIPCSVDPCPPVPTCKKPRSLESLCAFGAPLLIPETGNPFLCGKGPGQPTCPAAFDCNVKTGDDYGVCCASNKNFEKPGSCPVVATANLGESRADDVTCQTSCRHDLDCPEMSKCCFTEGCGKSCMQPANSTICIQQRHIAELLSQKEIDGRGYIPQCDENGNFVPRQCSRNGKICWCVSPEDGKNYPQSLGPSESVNCSNIEKRQRAVISARAEHCDHVICSGTCPFGFKMDSEGCPTCDCIESPCDMMKCPSGSHCEMIKDPACLLEKTPDECGVKTTCLSESLFVNPCTMGTPLTHMGTQKVVACSESANTCPSSHICVFVSPNKAGLCCVNKPRIEPTKEGMCPFISPAVCNSSSTLGAEQKGCLSDNDCEHSMKCCTAGGECTICADPLLKGDLKKANKMTTMCQYISESVDKVGGVFSKFRLAIPRPQCKDNGQFNEIQCDEDKCMCVDESGAEIPGFVSKRESNLTHEACIEARTNPKCLEMNCRLGCDYGYETLDGCKICECRNPCNSVQNLCSKGELCEMVDIDCWDGNCPPLPFCVPESLANGEDLRTACPRGTAFVLESNETLTCNPRARMLQCPDDYYCQDFEQSHDFGVCCPLADEDMFAMTAEERHGSEEDIQDGYFSQDMVDHEDDNSSDDNTDSASMDHPHHHDILIDPEHLFVEGTNALARSDDSQADMKMGQCPYLFPPSSGSCESQCMGDNDCEEEKKCCVNSCGGTHCTQPLLLTACQHQKSIIEHIARENGIPAKRFFIPQCEDNGEYTKIQSFGKFHWCVDSAGHEIQGTRVPSGKRPNCQRPSICPLNPCSLQCEFGYQLDASGCSVCQCKQSPCEDISCDKGEECRMMQLNCISDPCPPVPLCLPKLENPCPFGDPLKYGDSHERVTCGPRGSSCPSSHKCHLSPFGEYAVCCPKPKEVCFEKPDFSSCNSEDTSVTSERWFFNSSSNECQSTHYSAECTRGTRGYYANLFDTKSECLSVCPALTHCERTREKNVELRKRYQHFNYVPSCDPQTGEWNPTQCFDEVGMCWCVNKKGEPVKGTMTNGTPKCSARRGRLLGASSSVEPLVCEKGITVHRCNISLCEGKVCLGNPSAKCYINPCGGCQEKWMNEEGIEVDCEEGLTKCQMEMQRVVNFQAKRKTVLMDASGGNGFEQEIIISEGSGPGNAQFENALTEMFLSGSSRPHLKYNEDSDEEIPGYSQRQSRTQVLPIFANFGNSRILGLAASTVTYMGDPNGMISTSPRSILPSRPGSSEEKDLNVLLGTTRKQGGTSRATSIADILAEMMSTQASSSEYSQGTNHGISSMSSPDFIDLMPSSSQLVYGDGIRDETEHMLPPESYGALRMSYGYHPLSRVRRDQGSSMEDGSSQSRESSHEESYSVEETSQNPEILVSIIPRKRPGSCPPPNHIGILNLISGACRDECDHDHECGAAMKCCISRCGLKCTEVEMVLDAPPITPQQLLGLSMMTQPMIHAVPPVAATESFPSYLSGDDYDDENFESPKMILGVPQCSALDNEYSASQSQGELSWCVTVDGYPIHESLTRGKVQCDRNGTVIYRQSIGPICGDPRVKPMICTDQCLQTSCQLHPEAVCVMDPCDNCRPTYIRQPSGEKVECENKCSQRPADPGYCRGYIPRYTFNSTSGRCEEFIFGGCHGNDNNFKTMEECQNQCEEPQPVCELPVKVGPCRAPSKRWFFNKETQACESFWYSGCGGNENNFATRDQCENRCPDIVLCPLLLEGEMKECSRTKACRNVSCADSMNQDEYICHVDPCTCQATLKDLIGQEIKCEQKSDAAFDGNSVSEEDSTEMPEVTTQFLEDESAQILQILMDVSSLKSKCLSMAEISRVKCDSDGFFMPVQCPFTDQRCHCVDEAGEHLLNSPIFPLGSKMCNRMTVPQLDISISFPGSFDKEENSVQMGVEAQDLLRKLQAHLMEDKVEVEVLPSSTNLKFTLVGRNKFDVSYSLEEMVKKNAIGIRERGKFIPAELSKSKFGKVEPSRDVSMKPDVFDKVSSIRSELESNSLEDQETEESSSTNEDSYSDASVSAEELAVDAEYNVVAVLLTVVVAISVILAGFGMFLSLQKKKHTGTYPKKPFDSLAFTSQIYEFDTSTKKVPLDLPTFRATPPPPYTSNEEEAENTKNESCCGATKQ